MSLDPVDAEIIGIESKRYYPTGAGYPSEYLLWDFTVS